MAAASVQSVRNAVVEQAERSGRTLSWTSSSTEDRGRLLSSSRPFVPKGVPLAVTQAPPQSAMPIPPEVEPPYVSRAERSVDSAASPWVSQASAARAAPAQAPQPPQALALGAGGADSDTTEDGHILLMRMLREDHGDAGQGGTDERPAGVATAQGLPLTRVARWCDEDEDLPVWCDDCSFHGVPYTAAVF